MIIKGRRKGKVLRVVSKESEYAYDMNITTLGTEATGQKTGNKATCNH